MPRQARLLHRPALQGMITNRKKAICQLELDVASTQPPGMRLHSVAFYSKSHTYTARDARNAPGVIVMFVVLSATLFGPLLFSPENTDANSMRGTRKSLVVEHLSSVHQIASSDRRDRTVYDMGQRRPVSVLLKDQGKAVLHNTATEQEMALDKVDHAKLSNVVSISASAAILLGAFTAGKVAKRRLGHSAGGGVFVESDSNAAAGRQNLR